MILRRSSPLSDSLIPNMMTRGDSVEERDHEITFHHPNYAKDLTKSDPKYVPWERMEEKRTRDKGRWDI